MPINQVRPDTPLADTPEPRFVQDTIKPKVMTYAEKRAAQEIVKQKNIRARDSVLNRQAAAKGLTREQQRTQQEKDKNKENQPCGDLNGPNFKSTKCGISKAAAKESKSDWKKKRNGGPVVKKAQNGTSEYSDPKPLFDKNDVMSPNSG